MNQNIPYLILTYEVIMLTRRKLWFYVVEIFIKNKRFVFDSLWFVAQQEKFVKIWISFLVHGALVVTLFVDQPHVFI